MRGRKICVTGGCGAFQVRNARCAPCAVEYDSARGSADARGYGTEHRKIRKALLREFRVMEARGVTQLCWRCLEPMDSTQNLHADHSKVLASEGGLADCLTHAWCNTGKVVPSGPTDPSAGPAGPDPH